MQLKIPQKGLKEKENLELNESVPFKSAARKRYYTKCVPLHKAALKGEWEVAEEFLSMDPTLITAPITEGGETALHIAAVEGHVTFVSNLLTRMGRLDMEVPNKKGNTALCFAAAAGHVNVVSLMVHKNPNLLTISGRDGVTPLLMAALQAHPDMVEYLFTKIDTDFEGWGEEDKVQLLITSIESGLYDLATSIVIKDRRLAAAKDINGDTALKVLARKPFEFCRSRQHEGLFGRIASKIRASMMSKIHKGPPLLPLCDAYTLFNCLWNNMIRQQQDIESGQTDAYSDLLFIAVDSGNYDLLVELINRDPDFLYKVNASKRSIFHILVAHRHVQTFNLIYELPGVKGLMSTYIDTDRNNMLHLAAMLPDENHINHVPGAALQMQREVLWYKEVEKIVQPIYRNMRNKKGETPYSLFLAQHSTMMKDGEKQMKQMAKSCMLVTMLITTVIFAAAFTVPGGYDNDTGVPILENLKWFMIFPVSETVATLSSLTSMLIFLSMLISRYDEDYFLISLPVCPVIGVMALFVSIVAMMATMGTSLLFYEHGLASKMLSLVSFTLVPLMFIALKYKLLVSLLHCTFGCRWLFRSNNRLFD